MLSTDNALNLQQTPIAPPAAQLWDVYLSILDEL